MEYTLGERIKILRKEKGFNQAEFGAIFDMSVSTVSHIEKDQRKPTVELITNICSTLNVNCSWILLERGPIFNDDFINHRW